MVFYLGFTLIVELVASSFVVVCTYMWRQRFNPFVTSEYPSSLRSFSHVIFPRSVLTEYQAITSDGIAVPIKTATGTVTRHIRVADCSVDVIDYETPLNEIVQELNGKSIWVHGVRLPTEEDLARRAMSVPQGEG